MNALAPAPPAPSSCLPGTTTSPAPSHRARPLAPDSVLARLVYEIWSGRPVTLVKSPPGAGKSSLIADLVYYLSDRTDMTISVAAFTRDAALASAGRLAALLGPGVVHLAMSKVPEARVPAGVLLPGAPELDDAEARFVTVRTLSSIARTEVPCDLLIVDEAYQATFSLVSVAANFAQQILLVGDPGQIGPVITADTRAWDGMALAPHMRAPEVFEHYEDALVLHLPCTYRIGARSAAAIACLYDFPFESQRPARTLGDLPEIRSVLTEPLGDPYALATAEVVASLASGFIGMEVVTEGRPHPQVLTGRDVAVVVAHNAQQSAVEALLFEIGAMGVTVGTADRLQGGQWHAVVALDPMIGRQGGSAHALSSGRLCVMASRHMTHLTWVHDGTWETAIGDGQDLDALKALAVRRALVRKVAP